MSTGCTHGNWLARFQSTSPPPAKSAKVSRSVVHSEQAYTVISQLIDQPAGNEYLTRGIWNEAPDPLPHDLSTLLAANGLRVGLIRGLPPPELERLGTSEASSVGLVQRSFPEGKTRTIPLNGPLAQAQLTVIKNLPNDQDFLDVQQLESSLDVQVTPGEGTRVRVECTFKLQHGSPQTWLVLNEDETAFSRENQRPTLLLSTMTFAVELDRQDILIVGSTEKPGGTLGESCFYLPVDTRLRQRIFVLQAGSTSEPTTKSSQNPAAPAAQAWRVPRIFSRP
jgi:hypothetical protein